MTLLSHRPRLSGLAIWNMCVGFFGIQIGFGRALAPGGGQAIRFVPVGRQRR